MIHLTKKEYDAKHKDYRGIWDSDNCQNPPTNYNGRRCMLHYDNGTVLLVEGIGFKITDDEKY